MLYMVTFAINIPQNVSIYTSTMDPMGFIITFIHRPPAIPMAPGPWEVASSWRRRFDPQLWVRRSGCGKTMGERRWENDLQRSFW
jgi:hypothetical protein